MSEQRASILNRKTPMISRALRGRAQQLPHQTTDAEHKMWQALRNHSLGVKFRRQQTFGPYILDFYCNELHLAIEADGGQHTAERDSKRDSFLTTQGIVLLRFWNNDILQNLDGVIFKVQETIDRIKTNNPHPNPPPLEGEGK